jgi:hypothetical protein
MVEAGSSVVDELVHRSPAVGNDGGSAGHRLDDADDADGAVAVMAHAGGLDRLGIRGVAVARFGRARMVDPYVEVYRTVLSERR